MRHFLAILMLVSGMSASAQLLDSRIEKNTFYIGELNTLVLDASSIEDQITWPESLHLQGIRADLKNNKKDTILIEIIKAVQDSIKRNNLLISFTIWDSGMITLLPVKLYDTASFSFAPQLVQVLFPDTDPQGDILDIEEGRYVLPEELLSSKTWLIIGSIILAVLISIGIWWYLRKRKTVETVEEVITLPLKEEAERRLQELMAKKYWTFGQQKLHFIELSDIMRWYVQRCYHIDAMEKTTMELNAAMRMNLINTSHIEILTALLKQADFVKFAKLTLPEEEVIILNNQAIRFIEITEEKQETTEE